MFNEGRVGADNWSTEFEVFLQRPLPKGKILLHWLAPNQGRCSIFIILPKFSISDATGPSCSTGSLVNFEPESWTECQEGEGRLGRIHLHPSHQRIPRQARNRVGSPGKTRQSPLTVLPHDA
jgi:hypothetical protein